MFERIEASGVPRNYNGEVGTVKYINEFENEEYDESVMKSRGAK